VFEDSVTLTAEGDHAQQRYLNAAPSNAHQTLHLAIDWADVSAERLSDQPDFSCIDAWLK